MQSKDNDGAQSWYTSRMQAAGYNIMGRGCCFGIAHMGMQAFLVNEMAQFNARLDRIKQTSPESFANDFALLRQKADDLRQSGKIEAAQEVLDHIVDFKAFFDGVVLYQHPNEYPELMPNLKRAQDATQSLPLTQSIKLEQSGGPTPIDNLICLFTTESLTHFFKLLQENLGHCSFAILFSDASHAININYDATTKQWIWIDANHLPSQAFAEPELLTQALSDFFDKRLCLETDLDIYTNRKNAVEMQNTYQKLKTSEQYQKSYGQSTLDDLLNMDHLHPQAGYEIEGYLSKLFHKKILSFDEMRTAFKKTFAKVSSSDLLAYTCANDDAYNRAIASILIEHWQAKPSPFTMSRASLGGLFEGILESVSKLELTEQVNIFTATTYLGNNILMAVMFTPEKVSLILKHLERFSTEIWEKILTQKNERGEHAFMLVALEQPQFIPQLLDVIDKFPWQTQKECIEPAIKILNNITKSKMYDHTATLALLSTRLHTMRSKVAWKDRIVGNIPENIRNFLGLTIHHQKLVQPTENVHKKTVVKKL